MCGILGCISLNDESIISKDNFSDALEFMSHRGPDNHGVLQVDNVLLGHRRLSIIDISAKSNMPYLDEESGLIITYNGEIFNYLEIRRTLVESGHFFKTDSDTEVILKSYIEWGEKCLDKFNGMFAFFIYDSLKKEGFAARDRFGIKPFYFSKIIDDFIFSSEIKPLLHLGVKPTPNFEYINSYIVTSSLDYGSGTLINEIKQIKPGQYFTLKNNRISFTKWWTNNDLIIKLPKSYDDRIKLYRETLSDAIRIRLRSDVKLSMTLSGGMDSTAIYSLFKNNNDNNIDFDKPIDIYTIKYGKGSEVDEVDQVKKITSKYNDTFNPIEIDSSTSINKLRETIYFQEFPAWNVSSITFQEIYKPIRDSGSTVLLEGHGNDEILGGYHDHVNLSIRYFLRKFEFRNAWNAAKIFSKMTNKKLGKKTIKPIIVLLYGFLPFVREYRQKKRLENFKKLNLWDKSLNLNYPIKKKNSNFNGFNNELLHLVNNQILPTVLRVFDRATMSSSLEMRAPFMDYRLLQIAFSLKDDEKIGGGYQKRILRDSMKGYVPESIRTDKVKKGFSGDLKTWFNDEKNYSVIKNIISRINSKMPLNKEEVDNYFEKNFSDGFEWDEANVLSRILAFVEWWELYIEGDYLTFVKK